LSDPSRRWWNGKVAGISTILALPLGVLGLIGLEVFTGLVGDFTTWVADAWDNVWPTGQFIALVGICLVLAVLLVLSRRNVKAVAERMATASAEAKQSLVKTQTELAEAKEELAVATQVLESSAPDLVAADRILFDAAVRLVGSNSTAMRFVAHQPFGVSYDDSDLRDLREFVHEWKDADHEFHAPDLESAREELWAAAHAFVWHLAEHSFQRRDSSQYRIYPDYDIDWETAENAHVFEAIREADVLREQLLEAQQRFIRCGRRTLGL